VTITPGVTERCHADEARPDALGPRPSHAPSEQVQRQQGEQQEVDRVQSDEVRDPQIAADSAPVCQRHTRTAGFDADPVAARERDRVAVRVRDLLPGAVRPDQIEGDEHAGRGETEPDPDGPVQRRVTDALEQQHDRDHQAGAEQAEHTRHEDLLPDLVEVVGVRVEVAERASRRRPSG
jgi:hypothetical protein